MLYNQYLTDNGVLLKIFLMDKLYLKKYAIRCILEFFLYIFLVFLEKLCLANYFQFIKNISMKKF